MPVKVEQINEYLFSDTVQSKKTRRGSKCSNALYNSIRQSDYIVGLVVLDGVSGYLLPLTRLLQIVGLDLDRAMHEIDTLLGTLYTMRIAETSEKLYDEALIIAEQLGVTLCKQRIAARSVYRMAGGVNEDTESYYRINFWFATLDGIITDIQLRFGETQKAAAGLSRIIPSFMSFDDGDASHNGNSWTLDAA